jgi:hypothetical protein
LRQSVPCSWIDAGNGPQSLSDALLEEAWFETPLATPLCISPSSRDHHRGLTALRLLLLLLVYRHSTLPSFLLVKHHLHSQHGSTNSNLVERHLPWRCTASRDQAMGELIGKVQELVRQAGRLCGAESRARQHHWRGQYTNAKSNVQAHNA